MASLIPLRRNIATDVLTRHLMKDETLVAPIVLTLPELWDEAVEVFGENAASRVVVMPLMQILVASIEQEKSLLRQIQRARDFARALGAVAQQANLHLVADALLQGDYNVWYELLVDQTYFNSDSHCRFAQIEEMAKQNKASREPFRSAVTQTAVGPLQHGSGPQWWALGAEC